MTQELETASKAIQLPGCAISKTGLSFQRELTQEEANEVFHSLCAIEQSGLWWWGDFLVMAAGRWGEMYEQAAADSSYSYGTLANAKWVAERIQFSSRDEKLSYTHHREALVECGGSAAEAIKWLSMASENGWSVSKMREHIRIDKAKFKPTKDKGEATSVSITTDIKRWFVCEFRKQKPSKWPTERLLAVEEDMAKVDEYREEIRQELRARHALN